MLSKRLSQLGNVEIICRIKSPVKIAEGLTKIISTIKDLIKLSHRHNIENKLYNSHAMDKIYKIIGDVRVAKFLLNIYDEDLEGEALWKRLIAFLEKDLNIQQQKIIMRTPSQESHDNKNDCKNRQIYIIINVNNIPQVI